MSSNYLHDLPSICLDEDPFHSFLLVVQLLVLIMVMVAAPVVVEIGCWYETFLEFFVCLVGLANHCYYQNYKLLDIDTMITVVVTAQTCHDRMVVLRYSECVHFRQFFTNKVGKYQPVPGEFDSWSQKRLCSF